VAAAYGGFYESKIADNVEENNKFQGEDAGMNCLFFCHNLSKSHFYKNGVV